MHDLPTGKNPMTQKKLIVLAIGGNALLAPDEILSAENLIKNANLFAQQIANVADIIKNYRLVIVHGNGPQVGLLALQSLAYSEVPPYPFDILTAESQGMIGYLLQHAIKNILPHQSITTLLTQVIVDIKDHAFTSPSKPIGPFYTSEQYNAIKNQYSDWHFQKTPKGFRRVIASPHPQEILELTAIQDLLNHNHIIIAGGGGGIPCIKQSSTLKGVEAVIDKDLTASLLACSLKAEQLIILTDIDTVYKNWGTTSQEAIYHITPEELSHLTFESGSMKPKVEAACQFTRETKQASAIGHLTNLAKIIKKQAGTHIHP